MSIMSFCIFSIASASYSSIIVKSQSASNATNRSRSSAPRAFSFCSRFSSLFCSLSLSLNSPRLRLTSWDFMSFTIWNAVHCRRSSSAVHSTENVSSVSKPDMTSFILGKQSLSSWSCIDFST